MKKLVFIFIMSVMGVITSALLSKELPLTSEGLEEIKNIQSSTQPQYLMEILKDEDIDWRLKKEVIDRIGILGYKDAIPYLNQFVEEYNEYFVRTTRGEIPLEVHEQSKLISLAIAASNAVIKIEIHDFPFEEQLEVLKKKVKGNISERTGAINILEELGTSTTPFMLEWLKDRNVWVRRAAAYTLEANTDTDTRAFEDLIKALDDEDREVQLSVISTLGKIGDKRAIPYLKIKIKEEDKIMNYLAAKSLERLGIRTNKKGDTYEIVQPQEAP